MSLQKFKCLRCPPQSVSPWSGTRSGRETQLLAEAHPHCERKRARGRKGRRVPRGSAYPMEWDLQPGQHGEKSRSSISTSGGKDTSYWPLSPRLRAPKQTVIAFITLFESTDFLMCLSLTTCYKLCFYYFHGYITMVKLTNEIMCLLQRFHLPQITCSLNNFLRSTRKMPVSQKVFQQLAFLQNTFIDVTSF